MHHLHEVSFTNSFVDDLPGDHSFDATPRPLPDGCYALSRPTPVRQPELIAWSTDLQQQLGLAPPDELDIAILAGNHVAATMKPYAARYGGHQFGHWAGQLGDGRALTLGELPGGWELQLKGAGRTPFSRTADGRAVLRSSLREFLASEAMYYLGVPTTRALALTRTGESVVRDMFYDGHPQAEAGAITTRVAPSFLRLGNYQILSGPQLRELVDWTIKHHFPNVEPQDYSTWFEEICRSTAVLMVEWLRVGFVHGVMNTDNLSVLGLTIDYGPFGFLDQYDPSWTPNTTDLPRRRYCYGRQAAIALWNLERLAEALTALVPRPESGLELYVTTYEQGYRKMMAGKLGLRALDDHDLERVVQLNRILENTATDMTIFYRQLAEQQHRTEPQSALEQWINVHLERQQADPMHPVDRRNLMQQMNPMIVPRNYLLYTAIEDLERGTRSTFDALYRALQTPYADNEHTRVFAGEPPDWAKSTPGSSTLSCSS